MLLDDHDLLGRLVGFDSTSSNPNAPIADFVCEYLDRPGVVVRRQPSPDDRKVNVIAVTGEGSRDGAGRVPGLTLSGHLDVVPALEPEWTSDPFRLTEREGRWVGRGSCDMKASVALAMNLLAEHAGRARRPLALLLTCDEEIGSLGAQHYARHRPDRWGLPTSVVVGEPTGLRAVGLHKGHLTMRVTVHGRSAHSGSPHLGRNAVEPAARVVLALQSLAGELRGERCETSDYFRAVPFAVLNVGRIEGGTALNVVPDRCVVELGVRLLPGMRSGDAIDRIRRAVADAVPGEPVDVTVLNDNPPLELDERAEVHRRLCRVLDQPHRLGVSFASDAGPLATAGHECVLFGPGSIEVAHRPDEFVPVDEVARARAVLRRLVEELCVS